DRQSFRPTHGVPIENHSAPNLYRLRISYSQKIRGFSLEPDPSSAVGGRLSIRKPPSVTLTDLIGCVSLGIAFGIEPLLTREDNHLGIDFLDAAATPKVFYGNTGFICGGRKIGVGGRPHSTSWINLRRCGKQN